MTEHVQVRKFGIIAFVFFGILFGFALWRHKPILIGLFGTVSLIGLGFIIIPKPLFPIYRSWIKFSQLLGRSLTAFALILVYYLVITPSGLLKRIFGGRPLPVRPDKAVATYWVSRSEPAQPKERFLKRY